MTNYKDVKYAHTGASLTTIPTSGVSSGTFADARISAGSVTQHVTAFDDSKLQELGWKPKTKFEDGIKKTIKWYLNENN